MKYNPNIDSILWRIEFKELNHDFDANDFVLNEDGSAYVVINYFPSGIYSADVILVKIDNTGCLMDECHIGQPHYNTEAVVFPNPFSNEFTIQFSEKITEATLTLYNAIGQLQATQVLLPKLTAEGKYYVTYTAPSLANGLYFYQLTTNGAVISKGKIMKQ
jgi:Secretion system C-terminal sorting domain